MASDLPDPGSAQWAAGYRLERQVARGGMGQIFRAVELATGRVVAVKRIAEEAPSSELRTRLEREARLLQSLDHPNIVRCLEVRTDPSHPPHLVLEWLEGEDLASRQARAPLSVGETIAIARQALEGLGACHERGLVHRDIKPSNLFLVPTDARLQVKLLDFGVALQRDESTRLTRAGAVLGTLHYLSPEQARGVAAIDHRTDLYSLGVVLYELTTGRLPFVAGHAAGVLLKIATETPIDPRRLRPELPDGLARTIVRAMRRAPADRFQSAAEMRAALDDATAPAADPARPVPAAAPVERRLVCLLCTRLVGPASSPAHADAIGRIIEERGGVVQPLLERRVIGLFGLDQTAGDEAVRALQAGLEVLETVGPAAQVIAAAVHVGVGQGLQIDTRDLDRAVAAMDDLPRGQLVVDTATRQMAAAEVTLARVDGHDVVTSLVEQRRRAVLGVQTPTIGRASELAALRARAEEAATSGRPEAAVVFGPPGIGKSRLLSEVVPELRKRSWLCLEARLDSTRSGSPYALLGEALRRAAAIRLGHTGAEDSSPGRALESFLVRAAPGLSDDARPFIGEAIGVPLAETTALRLARPDPPLMRQQVARAFESLFRTAGQQGLVTLVLDDLQWSDEESLRLCEQLLERLEDTPLYVLGACRPDLPRRASPRALFPAVDPLQLELRPLGRRTLAQLIRAILDGPVSAEALAVIAEQWDGNPYFAEELVSWMVSGGALVRTERGWELEGDPATLEVPASIQSAIQGRIDRLPAPLKELLKASAVYGEMFWEEGCVALGQLAAPEELPRLEAAELVTTTSERRFAAARQWRFRHSMLHQVAYEMLTAAQLERLHREAAHWLEGAGERDAAVLARHLLLGGEPIPAAARFEEAGAHALAEGEPEGAVRFYDQALEHDPRGERHVERTVELARACYLLGANDRGLRAIEALEATAGWDAEPERTASVGLVKGRILFATARYDEAEQVLRRTLSRSDPGRLLVAAAPRGPAPADAAPLDSLVAAAPRGPAPAPAAPLQFDARHTLFWVVWAKGRYEEAAVIASELRELAEIEVRADQLCAAKLALAYCNVVLGDLSISLRLAGEAVEHARKLGHPYREVDSLLLLASAQELAGLYPPALESLEQAHRLAARLKTGYQLASIEVCQGRVHLLQGQPEQALARYRSAARRAQAVGDDRGLAQALVGQAKALAQTDPRCDLPAAEDSARRALQLTEGRVPPVEAEARAVLAQLALADGRVAEAGEHARTAVALIDQLGAQEQCELEILLVAHDVHVAAGEAEQARAMVERARRTLEQRSGLIADPSVLAAFLGQVPHHVRIRELVAG